MLLKLMGIANRLNISLPRLQTMCSCYQPTELIFQNSEIKIKIPSVITEDGLAMKGSILAVFAVTSAGFGLYFWLETKNLKKIIDSLQEALAEQSARKSQLKNKVDALNFRADQVQSHYAQAEMANKKLCGAMKRLSKKEKEACEKVRTMNRELEKIRKEIHDTYCERNRYTKMLHSQKNC